MRRAPTTRFSYSSTPACDSSGFGEGHTLLDSFQVTTDIDGNASFSRSGFSLAIGQFVTGDGYRRERQHLGVLGVRGRWIHSSR